MGVTNSLAPAAKEIAASAEEEDNNDDDEDGCCRHCGFPGEGVPAPPLLTPVCVPDEPDSRKIHQGAPSVGGRKSREAASIPLRGRILQKS